MKDDPRAGEEGEVGLALAPTLRPAWGEHLDRGIAFDETMHAKAPDRVQQPHFGCCGRLFEQEACLFYRMLPTTPAIAHARGHGRRVVEHQCQAMRAGVESADFRARQCESKTESGSERKQQRHQSARVRALPLTDDTRP